MNEYQVYPPREGYNLIAPFYDTWEWQRFWKRNEQPFIERWCNSLQVGNGADLGAGSGNNLKMFLDKGHHVMAYDISDMMLLACQQKYASEVESGTLECILQDISVLNASNKLFDWVLCNRVLSHIDDVQNVVRRIAHSLRKGGECFISDVHPCHNYEHTHYRIGNRDVIIETFKHPLSEMNELFFKNSLSIVDFREFTKSDLLVSDVANGLHSIQSELSPIFYYYILRMER